MRILISFQSCVWIEVKLTIDLLRRKSGINMSTNSSIKLQISAEMYGFMLQTSRKSKLNCSLIMFDNNNEDVFFIFVYCDVIAEIQ